MSRTEESKKAITPIAAETTLDNTYMYGQ